MPYKGARVPKITTEWSLIVQEEGDSLSRTRGMYVGWPNVVCLNCFIFLFSYFKASLAWCLGSFKTKWLIRSNKLHKPDLNEFIHDDVSLVIQGSILIAPLSLLFLCSATGEPNGGTGITNKRSLRFDFSLIACCHYCHGMSIPREERQ